MAMDGHYYPTKKVGFFCAYYHTTIITALIRRGSRARAGYYHYYYHGRINAEVLTVRIERLQFATLDKSPRVN